MNDTAPAEGGPSLRLALEWNPVVPQQLNDTIVEKRTSFSLLNFPTSAFSMLAYGGVTSNATGFRTAVASADFIGVVARM
jgi:hypothetical protein